MRETYSTNAELQQLIVELKKAKVLLWKRIAADLSKPSRQRRVVNLTRIAQNAKEGEVIVVPGKVLSGGDITQKVNVAAYTFSDSAVEKIKKANGSTMTIAELLKSNPTGKGIRILG